MKQESISRRSALAMILASASTSKLLPGLGEKVLAASQVAGSTKISETTRPKFHLTPALGWINDPQRPLWLNDLWNLWILWNGDYPTGRGTSWRRFTSPDLVNWTDQGVSIPKNTTENGDCWTGSSVIRRSVVRGLLTSDSLEGRADVPEDRSRPLAVPRDRPR